MQKVCPASVHKVWRVAEWIAGLLARLVPSNRVPRGPEARAPR